MDPLCERIRAAAGVAMVHDDRAAGDSADERAALPAQVLTQKEIFSAALGFGLGFGFCAIVAALVIVLVFA